jgi:adenine-specific DNA-methyltransferase
VKYEWEDISKTEAEIDEMVYELYGLSEEEIGIVEGRE